MPRILLIEQSASTLKELTKLIKKVDRNIDAIEYDPAKQGLPTAGFDWRAYDLVIMNHHLGIPRENGITWMSHFQKMRHVPAVIMLISGDDTDLAVNALKAGAVDFIDQNDLSLDVVKAALDEAFSMLEKQNMLNTNHELSADEMLFKDENEQADDFLDITRGPQVNEFENAQIEKFGLIVPGYELISEIGRGGMSTVYLAQAMEDEAMVCLKVMFTEGHEDPIALKRFMQEYTLISCLDHPHVVKIYERAFGSDFAYIAMEFFPSGDLTKRIASRIDINDSIEYIRQMCLGLVAVHELNVVHRDIKPGNILFRNDGTLCITDFGAAKNLRGNDDITINNQIVGTPYYMSPEQVSGMKIDHRSDLYSLGIMIYQMLTNQRPYTAKTIAQLMAMHLSSPVPELPNHLIKFQPLIDGLMAKDPDDRFQSANDVILGLDWIKGTI